MAQNVWDYFDERERECMKLSLAQDDDSTVYAEEAGSDGKRGRLLMRLHMTERAFLEVAEKVAVRGNSVHRDEYAYYLVIDGQEYWARERRPVHGEHGHTLDHERHPAGRITFKEAVKEAWKIVGEEEERTTESDDDDEGRGSSGPGG